MEIAVSQHQSRVPVTVFHITGDLAAESYEQLEEQVQQAIQSGARYLVLDLTKVPYVSSYGIRGISQIFTWLRDKAVEEDNIPLSSGLRDGSFNFQRLKLVNPSKQVLKVLSSTGIDMFVEIYPDLNKAIASF